MINFDELTIVFLIYKSEKILKRNLELLKKFKIIIIDNNNNSTFKDYVIQNYKNVISYHLSSKNIGFAAGNNLALRYCKTKYILFLNPDLFISEDFIQELLNSFNLFSNIGVVGPMLCDEKMLPSGNSSLFSEKLKIKRTNFEKRILNKLNKNFNNSLCCVDQIWGACMMFETTFFKKIGGFDEDFFIYYEDTYICKKIKYEYGKVVLENANSLACHLQGVSATYNFFEKAKLKFHHKLSEYIYLNKIKFNYNHLLFINFIDYFQRFLFNLLKFNFNNSFTNIMRILAIIYFFLNKIVFKKFKI